MKYTTFRNLALIGAPVVVLGGLIAVGTRATKNSTPSIAQTRSAGSEGTAPIPAVPAKVEQVPTVASPQMGMQTALSDVARGKAAGGELRPLDEEVMRLAARGGKGDKIKDAVPGKPYKINLFLENGKVVRAKVDLNRNDKWDEKWSFETEAGRELVKRQVSPTDDDKTYPEKYILNHGAWAKDE